MRCGFEFQLSLSVLYWISRSRARIVTVNRTLITVLVLQDILLLFYLYSFLASPLRDGFISLYLLCSGPHPPPRTTTALARTTTQRSYGTPSSTSDIPPFDPSTGVVAGIPRGRDLGWVRPSAENTRVGPTQFREGAQSFPTQLSENSTKLGSFFL